MQSRINNIYGGKQMKMTCKECGEKYDDDDYTDRDEVAADLCPDCQETDEAADEYWIDGDADEIFDDEPDEPDWDKCADDECDSHDLEDYDMD